MWAKLLLLFFVFSFLFKTDHSFDQDLGRHLKLGEIIWQTKSVPTTNLFSYTNPDFPFINTHWLFEILVYAVGLQPLLLIKIIIFLFSVWLILKIVPKENTVLLLPIGFIFLHVLRERTELRPEIFSFLFTASTYYILEKYLKKPTKLIYLLPIIQLLWINTHIYFFVGLVLQAIFLRSHIGCGKLKILCLVFILSVLFSLLNPNGLAGFLYPFNVTKNYGYTIVENQTIFLLESISFANPNFLFAKLSIGIASLFALLALIKRKFEIKNILLVTFGIVLSLMNVRSLPYLAFLTLPATLQNPGVVRKRTIFTISIVITATLLLIESYLYLNGDYYKYKDSNDQPTLKLISSSKGAMDFVLKNNLPQPIFNNFDIGSYIIYRGYPKYQVFVDGRPEAYPKEFFTQTYIPSQSDYFKFKDLDKQYKFKSIIFSHTDQTPWGKSFLSSVLKDKEWKTVYIDDFMIVLALQDVPLEAIDLSKLKAADFKFVSHRSYLNLGLFLFTSGFKESAETFITRSLQLFPQSLLGNALFGVNVSSKFFW